MSRLFPQFTLIGILFVFGCSPLSNRRMTRELRASESQFQNHTGLVIYDPVKEQIVFDYNGHKHFTPASNTKILTFLACLDILKDSIPAARYVETPDSVTIWGTGDPSFLNPDCYSNDRLSAFLKAQHKPMNISFANSNVEHFGPGWAWDDFNDDYSQERSSLSMYGNSFKVFPLPDQNLILPGYFKRFLHIGKPVDKVEVKRDPDTNSFTLNPGRTKTFKEFTIPFKTDPLLFKQLLIDTLHKNFTLSNKTLPRTANTLYSIPADSLYKVMMQRSDNHIAEQLLLVCSGVLSDTLNPDIAIRYTRNKFFGSTDKLVWRDGSGLSRYNMITPHTIISAWQNIYKMRSVERLYPLLATGGKPGTLKNFYSGNQPYVFGKTGTISNNFNLSGFLITKKGKTLMFAFMNANYVAPVNDIRKNVERILNLYYENY